MPLENRFAKESETSAERAWADRIRGGDRTAFEALYRKYWQPLYAFAFRYVRSKEDAEEVVQDVFFRIWRGRADWVPAGAVRNYVYCAVRNAARDRLERTAVARRWHVGQVATAAGIQSELEVAELVALVQRVETQLARGLKFLRDRMRPEAQRTSAPADGSAVNTWRPTPAAAPRGA